MTTETTELLPCPFDGFEVKRVLEPGVMPGQTHWQVWCPSCGTRGPIVSPQFEGYVTSREQAAQLWNQRVEVQS